MFANEINDKILPPNFLNSILTNQSLYDMFKNEFDENIEYFQGIEKSIYLEAMLKFIEDTLFSQNIFSIYIEIDDIDSITRGKLKYIKSFYDDFLLEEFKNHPEHILKTRFFKGFAFALNNDLYASKTREFNELYDYVFKLSVDYEGIVEVLMKDIFALLEKGESLSIKDFQLLLDYIKNNINSKLDMNLVTSMLRNHALKKNHIFDREVSIILVSSTIIDYLESFGIEAKVFFEESLENGKVSCHDLFNQTITLDMSLIDGFISLNYVELFEVAFYEADILKSAVLLKKNEKNVETLRTIMNFVVMKVDMDKIFQEEDYKPSELYADMRAVGFIKALRFFSSFGINLFSSYVATKTKDIDIDYNIEIARKVSKKEISLDQRFLLQFKKSNFKEELLEKYEVLRILFNKDGARKDTIDLIKSLNKEDARDFITEYLHSRVIEPDKMLEDVNTLLAYKPKIEFIKEFIERELKYIYVDTFYYSLDSFIKLNTNTKLDIDEYLDDLLVKANCIKDTPLTHRFIDEVIFTINDAKQNV